MIYYKMKDNIIDTKQIKISDLFNNKFYNVSDFQRPYAWGKEQQDELVKDLVDNLSVNKEGGQYTYQFQEYFLGNIILKRNQDNDFDIVDGQQRLITLVVLLISIRNRLDKIVSNKRNKEQARKSSESLIKSIETIVYINRGKKKEPLITPLGVEKDYFWRYILPREYCIEKPNQSDEILNKYDKCLLVINDRIDFFLEEKYGGSSLKEYKFLEGIYNQIINTTVISITINDEAAAYKIFSNINSKGMHLAPTDLIKNDFLYKTRKNEKIPGVNSSLDLWNEIYKNIRENTAVSFNDFYKYAWFTIHSKDISEYFDEGTNLFELFQEKYSSESQSDDILEFFCNLNKLSQFVKDFKYPQQVKEWKGNDWPIYVEKLSFLSLITKDGESNKYILWLLPMYYKYKLSNDEKEKKKYLSELKKRITFISDVLLIYTLMKEKLPDEVKSIENIQDFFDRIFKEIATFNLNNSDISERENLENLENDFMGNIENETNLINMLSLLSYSKHNHHLVTDRFYIERILKRLNEDKKNALLDYKVSIEHIIEDAEGTKCSSNIGNLVSLEKHLNDEAGRIKKDKGKQALLKEKFETIYPKSSFPEVEKLLENFLYYDFDCKAIDDRSKIIIKDYIQKAFGEFSIKSAENRGFS
ncbi:DUF262 domain-containing protein [Enterococcus sp. LX10]|uniref:DUF262 domain-containing protein n=1 Tax=Enterococcus sp. LX10 TaxID=2920934 RepID=UPI00201EA69F|nr:DUF262 domain-containing protein [Enterococcus sp. LX10]